MIRAERVLGSALALVLASSAFADEANDACQKAPTRGCVLEAAANAGDPNATPYVKASQLGAIARAQQTYGLADAAKGTFARATEMAKQIPADFDLGTTVPSLVATLAEMGDMAAALAQARSIDKPLPRAAALTGVAAAMQRQGKADEAKATFALASEAAEATPPDRRAYALALLAVGEARVGLPDAAATFDRALAAASAKNGAPATNASVDYVIIQRIKTGDFARTFVEISDLDESAKNYLLTALVAAAANAGAIDVATAAAPSITNGSNEIRAMATLAVANFRAGHAMPAAQWIVQAQGAADRETTPPVKAEAEADIAGAEAVGGMALRAKAQLEEARASIEAPATDPVFRRAIARASARALARAGDVPAALDMLHAHVDPKSVGVDLLDISGDLAATKQLGAAFEVLLAIPVDNNQRAGALAEFAAKLPS